VVGKRPCRGAGFTAAAAPGLCCPRICAGAIAPERVQAIQRQNSLENSHAREFSRERRRAARRGASGAGR